MKLDNAKLYFLVTYVVILKLSTSVKQGFTKNMLQHMQSATQLGCNASCHEFIIDVLQNLSDLYLYRLTE